MSDERAGGIATAGAFAVSPDGSQWTFDGALTFDNAAAAVEAASKLEFPANGRVDLSGLGTVDSSALAVIFALKRRAKTERHRLSFDRVPEKLASLARVYGVEELL